MCAPGISAVAGLALGVMQAGAQMGAAQADYNAKAERWRQNVVNSETAARDEHRQILMQQMQEQDKTVQKNTISIVQEAQKSSSVEASAGQAGFSGVSVDNLLRDIAGKSLLNRTYADRNYMFVAADINEKLKASDTRLVSRINSVERPTEPSPLAGMATIAGAGINAFKALTSGGGSFGDG